MSHLLLALLFIPIVLVASGLLFFLFFGFATREQDRLEAQQQADAGAWTGHDVEPRISL
jgi:hypothetical protein